MHWRVILPLRGTTNLQRNRDQTSIRQKSGTKQGSYVARARSHLDLFAWRGMLAKPRTISNRQFFPQHWKQLKSSSPVQNKQKIRKDVNAVY